jgi:hypothetical protein
MHKTPAELKLVKLVRLLTPAERESVLKFAEDKVNAGANADPVDGFQEARESVLENSGRMRKQEGSLPPFQKVRPQRKELRVCPECGVSLRTDRLEQHPSVPT